MRAVRYHGTRDVRVEEIEPPEVRPGTVKVAPEWCGICGSDVHEYLAGPETIPTAGNPHPITGEAAPIVLGHEFAGRVVEVGAGVTGVAVGDPVAIEPIIRDTTCRYCQNGDYNYCPSIGFHGLSGGGGGLAEFTVVPEYMVHRLPDSLPTDIGALIEPLAVGWHAVRRAEFEPGQTALVVGAGPIGLVTLLALKDAGASFVAVAELSPARKLKAEQMGADLVLDPSVDDVVGIIQARTASGPGGPGADVTFDASGHQATLTLALQAVRKRGRVVNIALWEHPATIDMFQFLFTEASLTSSCAYANDHAAVIDALASGRIDASPLITKRIELEQVVSEGFESLATSRDRDVKILVRP